MSTHEDQGSLYSIVREQQEDKANVLGSQTAGSMMLRHFEYGEERFLTWDGAHKRWLEDGKNFNVYEVWEDGTFQKVLARREMKHE